MSLTMEITRVILPFSLRKVVSISAVKTSFAEGGYALQFNVIDEETLLEAQRNPEQYESLQVRVTGYSAYFTKLSKYEQDQIIAQNAHGL